jgi:RimJ/RimL family protein N-acetyltransferase
MHVRRATSDDVPAIVEQIAIATDEGWTGAQAPLDREDRAQRIQSVIDADDPETMFVAEDDDGRVVGHAGVHATRIDGVLSFGMAVLPDARGGGVGRLLVDTVVEQAQALGAHKLELEAWLDNARAIALYASAGFEVEGVRRSHYRRGDGTLRSSLIMARLFV